MKKLCTILLVLAMALSLAVTAGMADTQPVEGNLEFISCYAAGGGHDLMLRSMERVLHEEKLLDNNITIVYKPGGNSAVGMSYCASKKGSDHHIMCSTIGFITAPLQNDLGGLNYKSFTPIARLAVDTSVIWVRSGIGIETLDDLVNYKGPLTWAGAPVGGMEHQCYLKFVRATGIDCTYVPFESDGETMTAILGGHADIIGVGYNDTMAEYMSQGALIPVAVSGEARKASLPEVPTLVESGLDVVVDTFRSVVGAPGMSPEAVAYYEEVFKKMVETDLWQTVYLDVSGADAGWMGAEEFAAYLDKYNADQTEILGSLGMLAN